MEYFNKPNRAWTHKSLPTARRHADVYRTLVVTLIGPSASWKGRSELITAWVWQGSRSPQNAFPYR